MAKATAATSREVPDCKSVLDLTSQKARAFFLKHESYCSIDLPPYFKFDPLLTAVNEVLDGGSYTGLGDKPHDCDGLNHILLSNKDGRHAWRPLELIHPAIYVSLVNQITSLSTWKKIRDRFGGFQSNRRMRCLSIPVESRGDRQDKASQILRWWQNVEQASIENALRYAHIVHADITDCYGAIYTHSIAWALHDKDIAKRDRRKKSLIGNVVDSHIQAMRHGQTNGIPQGSVLMDFVAEMVLGYADMLLSKNIQDQGITDYEIIRYRDDYKIFVQSSWDGDRILKCLTETLISLGFKLSASKTVVSSNVIRSAIKPDKLAWLNRRRWDKDFQKHLLIVHDHCISYPNAGSLIRGLQHFYRRIQNKKQVRRPLALISIVVDIAYRSPKTYPICAAILSKLISCLAGKREKKKVLGQIQRKFRQLPNTNHMEIWLQRISHPLAIETSFEEPLCRLISGQEGVSIWDNDWISCKNLKKAMDVKRIVDDKELEELNEIVPMDEVELFGDYA